MKLTIIGTGYVGLVTGVCLSDLGNEVICVNRNEEKINKLKQGLIPFFEPGLDDLVQRNLRKKRISFTTDLASSLKEPDIVFITVGTPPQENGEADLKAIWEVTENIAKNLDHFLVVVVKSTVPVGTSRKVKKLISQFYPGEFEVIDNPEFLREGSAVEDFRNPDRIIIGGESPRAQKIILELYNDFSCPKVVTTWESAEMIKYASNAFLATKISFINEIANVCENVDADVEAVAKGIGLDKRIGPAFLRAGVGFAGSCFPKDVRALHQIAGRNGYHFELLRAVIEVNNNQKWIFFKKIRDALGEFTGKTIGLWGLAFKPNTDDVRESIALEIAGRLLEEEAKLRLYDPEATENAKEVLLGVEYCQTPLEAARGVDCLIVITEWDEFRNPDFEALGKLMKRKLIIDGRNIYEPDQMKKLGFEYISVGRGNRET